MIQPSTLCLYIYYLSSYHAGCNFRRDIMHHVFDMLTPSKYRMGPVIFYKDLSLFELSLITFRGGLRLLRLKGYISYES